MFFSWIVQYNNLFISDDATEGGGIKTLAE